MKRALATFDVFVGHFNKGDNDAIEKKVSKMFIKFGETKGFFVKEANQGKFVVVKYLCEEDANRAVKECNGILLDGLPVLCRRMEKRLNKPAGTAPGTVAYNMGKDNNLLNKQHIHRNPDIVPHMEPTTSSSPGPNETEISVASMSTSTAWSARNQTCIMVTHVETPTLLWAQTITDSQVEDLMNVASQLAEVCPSANPLFGRVDINKVYACKYSVDGVWYRCQARHVYSLDKIKVQYIDFGNFEDVNPQDLVELPAELTMPKPFATKILLHGVRFITTKELEATAYVREVTDGKYVVANPTFRLPDGTGQFAELYIDDIHLNQDLINKGFAVRKQSNKQQQMRGGAGDAPGRLQGTDYCGGYSGGYGQSLGNPLLDGTSDGMGKSAARQVVGDTGKLKVTLLPSVAAGNGQAGLIAPYFQESPLAVAQQPGYSDLKTELNSKSRSLEKAIKEKDMASAELNNLRGKMKTLQSEFTAMTNKLQDSITTQIQTAIDLAEKVRKLRLQFSDRQPTLIDEALQLICSEHKLNENSVSSMPAVMATLSNYQAQQKEICQLRDTVAPKEMLEKRNKTRRQLYDQLTACLKEMEQIPFTSRAQSIGHCEEMLKQHYDNFFSVPRQQCTDMVSVIKQYEQFKSKRKEDFEASRKESDNQHDIVQTLLTRLQMQLSLTPSAHTETGNLDLSAHLKQYSQCLQHEINITDIENIQEANFIASLVQTAHHELLNELICANNFLRMQSDFTSLRDRMEKWLDNTPDIDRLLENRRALKSLKSKLRHRLADKHDAEENDDGELLDIVKDVAAIQQEIHTNLLVEQEELAHLADLADSHFPELLALHPDCGIDVHLAYNGLVKPSHEVDHYDLKTVPGTTGGLFYSTSCGKSVIVLESLLSDGHHLGREDYLAQLTAYNSITHPALIHPSTVFFDKHISKIKQEYGVIDPCICALTGNHNHLSNNRHAYMLLDKDGDILANYVEHIKLTKQDAKQIIRSVTEGLKVLHDHKVLHGEINPHNIMLRPDGSAGLLPPDFSCRPIDRVKNKYVAPNGMEFYDPGMQTMPSALEPTGTVDMYCIGLLILWLLSPTKPVHYNSDGSLDLSHVVLDQSLNGLVKSLTSHLPQLRSSADKVLQTQYILQPLNEDTSSSTNNSKLATNSNSSTHNMQQQSQPSVQAFQQMTFKSPSPGPHQQTQDMGYPVTHHEHVQSPYTFTRSSSSSPLGEQVQRGRSPVSFDMMCNLPSTPVNCATGKPPTGYHVPSSQASSSFDFGNSLNSAEGHEVQDEEEDGWGDLPTQNEDSDKKISSCRGMDMNVDTEEEFEIGTFSVEECESAENENNSRGRRITRELSQDIETARDLSEDRDFS